MLTGNDHDIYHKPMSLKVAHLQQQPNLVGNTELRDPQSTGRNFDPLRSKGLRYVCLHIIGVCHSSVLQQVWGLAIKSSHITLRQ